MELYKFFDTIGLAVFTFILLDAAIELLESRRRSWRTYVRLFIGIGGLIVDGFLVLIY